MAVRSIITRFDLQGDANVRQRTAAMAREVDQNFERIKQSGEKASVGLSAIDVASRGAQTALASLGAGLTLGGLVSFAKQSADAADRLNDLGKRVGVAGSTLQAFDYVATLSGTSVESFAASLGKMNKVIGEAISGNDAAKQKIEGLGISLRAITDLAPEQQFLLFADRISQLGTEAEKTKATMDVFGRSGTELAQVMENGAAGIQEMLDRARDLGLVMSQEQLDRISAFNDEWDTMKLRLEALGREGFLVLAENADLAGTAAGVAAAVFTGRLVPSLTASAALWVVNTQQAIAYQVALARMAGASATAAAAGSLLARSLAFFGGPPGLAVTAALTAYALHTDKAKEAQERYNTTLGDFRSKAQEMASASGERRKELEEDTNAIIAAHIRELQSLNTVVESYASLGKRETGAAAGAKGLQNALLNDLEALGLAGREVAGKLGLGTAPSEVMAQSDSLRKAIKEMQELLKNPTGAGGGGGEGGGGGDTTPLDDLIGKQRDFTSELKLSAEQMRRLAKANDESAESYQRLKAQIEIENELRAQGFKLGTDEYELNRRLLSQRSEAERRIEQTNERRKENVLALEKERQEQQRLAEEMARQFNQPFENALESFQGTVRDKIRNGFEGGFDDALDIVKDFAAEMATLLVFRPQVFLNGGVGAAMGGLFNGTAGSGGSNANSLVSNGSGLIGKIGGFTGAIDAWGAASLPGLFGTGAPAAGLVGPTMPGLLGGAGIGLSSVALPVAGMALGMLASKVFSGPRPHPASTFGTQGTNFNTASLLSKHMDTSTASGMAGNLQQALAALSSAGLDTGFIRSLQGGVDDGTGFYSFGDWSKRNPLDTVTFKPGQEDKGLAEFTKLLLDAAMKSQDLSKIMDADLLPALKNLTTEGKVSADVITEIVNALTRDDLRKAFLTDVNTSLIDQLMPGYSARLQEEQRFLAQMEQARKLGVDAAGIAKIQELHQLNVKNLLNENNSAQTKQLERARELTSRFGRVSGSLSGFIDELNFGQFAGTAPLQTRDNLRAELMGLESRSKLGDIDAQERITQLLPQLLRISGPATGFNEQYRQDQELARRLAEGTKSVADRQLDIQARILEAASTTNDLLAQYLSGGSGGNANEKLISALQGGYKGLSVPEIDSIFSAAGVTVAPGEGRRTAFLNANSGANAQLNALFKAIGVPGFAAGGIVGGASGIDANLARVTRGEGILNTTAMRGIGEENFHYMNRTGRVPSGDSSGIEVRLERIEAAVLSLARITAASGDDSIGELKRVSSELYEMRNRAILRSADI